MSAFDSEISRISKLLIDRDQADPASALADRQSFAVTLCCGEDVAKSYCLQLAVLTTAATASRCFPGAVSVALSARLSAAPLLVWPWLESTFGGTLADILGTNATRCYQEPQGRTLIFGDVAPVKGALRVTFDGWTALVGPASKIGRLRERQYFSAAGVLAGSLAVSELFLSFASINLEASRRTIGLSLWRPDLDFADPDALGVPVEILPKSLWVLGLGHLGNAYLWTLATLPYPDPKQVELALLDFDRVVKDNVETGVLLADGSISRFKAHACDSWLQRHGFAKSRLVERRFDENFKVQDDEPKLALCGFDTNPARRAMREAGFLRVVESGLGGTLNNFDFISLHTLPNARSVDDLWPDLAQEEQQKIEAEQERIANENSGYQKLKNDVCGRRDLAGKSVAVPFVGTTAASFVVAEAVKLFHDGPAYYDIRMSLGDLGRRHATKNGSYTALDIAGLKYADCANQN